MLCVNLASVSSSADPNMDVEGVNHNTFPSKLWRLVNNPFINSILWDAEGKAVVIDRQLFEVEILSQYGIGAHNADAFKTTNFSSIVRQLNLYGFKKDKPATQKQYGGSYLCFSHPNFQREHPGRVAFLRRRTAEIKARTRAAVNRGKSVVQQTFNAPVVNKNDAMNLLLVPCQGLERNIWSLLIRSELAVLIPQFSVESLLID